MSEELTWLPAWQIRNLIAERKVSVTEVLEHFLGRIEKFNPILHAMLHVDTGGAREQAKRADQAVLQGERLGPLHGIPVSVKSHIAVQGMPRSWASQALGFWPYDDIAVERLRKAGAIIVGTNSMMVDGGEATRVEDGLKIQRINWDVEALNPWDTSRVPGWSTSGGSAAVAAALVPVAIGSDGGGSNRIPAAYCGVVGVHPTNNLVPHVDYGRPQLSLHGQTHGPVARSVRDAAIVLNAIAGPDGRDFICVQEDPPDYLETIDNDVAGMRVAWSDDFGYTRRFASAETERVIEHVRAAAMELSTLGVSIEPVDDVWEAPRHSGPADGEPRVYEVMGATNLQPLPPVDPEEYRAALDFRARNWEHFRKLFRSYDLLLSVTAQRVAVPLAEWSTGWMATATRAPGSFTSSYTAQTTMFNLLGFPALSVPCGFIDGLPVGLQVIGAPGSEARIFQLASAFQRAFPRDERPAVS